jgi:hypothetical protein
MADSDVKKVEGVVVEATPIEDQEKVGDKCCGCCCDFRRAVVVLSIIGIVINAIYCALAATAGGVSAALTDDEDMQTGYAVSGGLFALIYAVGMVFNIFQLCGALKYHVCILATCLTWHCIEIALSIWSHFETYPEGSANRGANIAGSIIGSIIFGILLGVYPIGMLIKEINAGTMSEKTYPREAYSCCCEPKV